MFIMYALFLIKPGHVSICLLLVNAARNLLCRSFDGLHLVAPSLDTVIKTDRGDRLVQTCSHFFDMNMGLLIICTNMRNCFCLAMSCADCIYRKLLIGISHHSVCSIEWRCVGLDVILDQCIQWLFGYKSICYCGCSLIYCAMRKL